MKRTNAGTAADRLDYGRILHEMADGFALHEMLFDAEGRPTDYRFLDANPAYERITGLRIDDIRGKTVREVIPEIEDRWIETYGRVVSGGEQIQFTNYAEALDKHFEVWAYRPDQGRFVVMIRDVTAKVAAAAAARERDQLFHLAIQTTSDGFFVSDPGGWLTEVNDAYLRMTGWSREEFIGTRITDHEAVESAEEIAGRKQRIREFGHDSFETRHRRKDGSLFDAAITVSYLEEGGGRFLAFCRHRSRKDAERATAAEKFRLERALEATRAGLWDWSLDEETVVFDGRWAEIAGYDLGAEGALPIKRWRELCHPDDRRIADGILEAHLSGKIPLYFGNVGYFYFR